MNDERHQDTQGPDAPAIVGTGLVECPKLRHVWAHGALATMSAMTLLIIASGSETIWSWQWWLSQAAIIAWAFFMGKHTSICYALIERRRAFLKVERDWRERHADRG